MRKVVLYIGSIFLPDKSAGAQRALSLSKSFRDLGYKVVLVGMSEKGKLKKDILKTKGISEGFDTYSVKKPTSMKDWVHHTVSISEFIAVINYYGVENIYSIVAMEYEAIALYRLVKYCKKHGIELIVDAEEWYGPSQLHFPMNIAKNFDTFLRMRWVYRRKVENMICISRFFYNFYKMDIINRVYIPGCVDLSQQKWKEIPPYRPNINLTFGYAGNPGNNFEKERLDWLIQCISELNFEGYSCCLIVAGVGEKFLMEKLGGQSINWKAICILGTLSHSDCLKVISKCDFSVIVREDKRVTKAGFPTKLSESFGCCTPVISTPSSNISEYIIDGKTGFLCDGFSKQSVKEMLKHVISNVSTEQIIDMHRYLNRCNPLFYKNFTADLEFFLKKGRCEKS